MVVLQLWCICLSLSRALYKVYSWVQHYMGPRNIVFPSLTGESYQAYLRTPFCRGRNLDYSLIICRKTVK